MQIYNWEKPNKIDLELTRTQGRRKTQPKRKQMIKFAIDRLFWKIAVIVAWGLVAFVAMYAVVILCADIGNGEDITSLYTTSANIWEYTPTTMLMFYAPDGRTATIDFGGDRIIYSGDLPVDESAKLFFEEFKHLCGENN